MDARMKIVPVLKCRNMQESLAFYTKTLGFRLKDPGRVTDSPVIDIVHDGIELQLSTLSGDGAFGSAVNIQVDNVDELFTRFRRQGLDTSGKEDSPVHQGPVDQSWGTREFYVTDPSGNTLRFRQLPPVN